MGGISGTTGGAVVKRRMTYTEFLDDSPMTSSLWLLLLGVCLAQILDGMDFQASTFALPGIIHEFRINPGQAGGILSIANVGLAIGAIVFPTVCDWVGRRPVFQWVLLTYAAGTLISALARDYHTLLIGRFIAGLGLGAQLPIVFAILAEFAPKRLRHVFVPLGPGFWSLGWTVAALLSIGLIPHFGWRAIYWVGVVPAALAFFVRLFMPESIRFLLTKGKTEEAGRLVTAMAAKAGMGDVELVPPVVAASQVKLNFSQQLSLLRLTWAPMVVLAFFYFCWFVETWGVNAWLPTIFIRQGFTLARSFWYTMIILATGPIATVFGAWLQERVDRKWAMFVLTMTGSVFFVLFGLSFQYHWPVWVSVGSQLLQSLLVLGLAPILFTLSAELFPTPIRTLGIGIVNGFGRFGAVFGSLALGLFLHLGHSVSTVIYLFAIPMIIAAVLVLMVIRIDPRQQSLEHISELESAAHAGH